MKQSFDVLITRYLAGEMTEEERLAFESELATHDSLNRYFQSVYKIWAHDVSGTEESWDVENAWNRFTKENMQPRSRNRVFRPARLYWAAAAAVVVLVLAFGLFFNANAPELYAYTGDHASPIELTDGTKIYLNKDSELKVYPFKGNKRHTELRGEAFFEVMHDSLRPFTIASGGTLTEVVGTSFNIRETSGTVHLFVNSGKVIFSSLSNHREILALTRGEAALFKENKMQMIANPSPNVDAWHTQQLRFVNMPLSGIIEDISAYFDQEIIIEKEGVDTCRISIPLSFREPKIESVLTVIAGTIKAKIIREGERYIIRDGSCQ